MKYPDDFDVPAFPAGRPVAFTRMISVAIMAVFLLIAFVCVGLYWTQKAVKIHPFLVSINPITGQWDVVGHNHKNFAEVSATRLLQESVIGKFMQYWFLVTDSEVANDMRWKACNREVDCTLNSSIDPLTEECALFCITGDTQYVQFVEQIIPGYQARIANGETWHLDKSSLQISPIGMVGGMGGTWQVRANILSDTADASDTIGILAYVQIGYDIELYPKTLGYYVNSFNAYKIR